METQSQQGQPALSQTTQELRRQLEVDRKRPPTPEEQAQIEAEQQAWAAEMEQLDANYQAMLNADPELRQRLYDGSVVLDALLEVVTDDREER